MSGYDYDLIVIGAGSGGVRAARIAASHGARVAIAEAFRVGGTCVIRGCVPKKLYVMASRFKDEFDDAKGFGWHVGETAFDWPWLVAAKEKEITRLSGLYEQTLSNNKVELIRARATIAGPNAAHFSDGRTASARYILVATGGAPVLAPHIPGLEWGLSSNEIFDLPTFPQRLLIVGAGYIAVEFASIFARLGAQVYLAYRADLPLRGFDEDLRKRVAEALTIAGVSHHVGALPTRIDKTSKGFCVSMSDGETRDVDAVLVATGRRPLTQNLGLERAGVATRENGAIVVDEHSRTNVPSIYAVGDVTDRINLTPVAIREGHAFADSVFGDAPTTVDYDCVASAVFTTPEVGAVGLAETAAQSKYGALDIYETSFRPMKATLSGRNERTFMKLVVDAASQRVVGAHIFGHEAGEMAQLVAIPMRMGATKRDFDATMAVHPTAAEELVTMRTPSRRVAS
ncbi:glutathione-disulfide reductase [Methylocystis parvus]|uniref:Glutathione reductase n=1 Tax=Methylocystis parvus TaxID=134 RepID=A0A6B8M738_9HYPH|nr:glutathione-disulfide reductase [Methylocystis parvus]QGM97822.1 glutathione-disulfide reductase [Methylocystis parvus]WBK01869.1 glutathione-disulfide reductase [Methylocystis parvus OBBP]